MDFLDFKRNIETHRPDLLEGIVDDVPTFALVGQIAKNAGFRTIQGNECPADTLAELWAFVKA